MLHGATSDVPTTHAAALEAAAHEVAREISAQCSLSLSSCTLAALQEGGRAALPVIMAAKRSAARIECDHEPALSPTMCSAELFARGPSEEELLDERKRHSLVVLASTPEEVRELARAAVGMPVLLLLGSGKIKAQPPDARARQRALHEGLAKVASQVATIPPPAAAVASSSIENAARGGAKGKQRKLSRKDKKREKSLKRLREKEMEKTRAEEEALQQQQKKRKRRKKKASDAATAPDPAGE